MRKNFYGIDVTPFSDAAWEEVFSSPVVGCFGPLILLSAATNYNVDFLTVTKENLQCFTIPLSFDIAQTAVVHGLAGWFDLHFLPPSPAGDTLRMEEVMASTPELEMKFASTSGGGSEGAIDFGLGTASTDAIAAAASHVDPTISHSYMSTSPYSTPTHWQQVRFLFQEPLAINKGQRITGEMQCQVNEFRCVVRRVPGLVRPSSVPHASPPLRSYTLTATLKIDGTSDELLTRRSFWRLDRQVYSWTSASPSTQ